MTKMVEMTKKKSNDKEEIEMTKMAVIQSRSPYESFAKLSKTVKTVIPDKRSAIRNPGIKELVPRLHGDDVWIPACVGMTKLAVLCGCAKFSSIFSARTFSI